jgi:hypothetical protein
MNTHRNARSGEALMWTMTQAQRTGAPGRVNYNQSAMVGFAAAWLGRSSTGGMVVNRHTLARSFQSVEEVNRLIVFQM